MFKVGIENLDQHLALFNHKRVGLITNPTGVDRNLKSTIDILQEQTTLAVLFAPEHGVRGDLQAGVRLDNYVDEKTGVMVYSLYGQNKKPTKEMLAGVDLLCFDIQDVGARYYTYLYTMAYAMMAAKENNIPFVVFDRPNPVNGITVEGTILDLEYRSFVGYYPLVQRYGLTIGELAVLFNELYEINCDLTVVKMTGYDRHLDYDALGFPWILPSPNLPTVESTYHYLATCYYEGTNVSEGRGTTKPFSFVGAPWFNSQAVIERLNKEELKGVQFRPVYFTPTFSKHQGELCEGIELILTDKKMYEPVKTGLTLLHIVKEIHEEFAFIKPFKEGHHPMIDLLTGDNYNRLEMPLSEKLKRLKKDTETFRTLKERYHLYETTT
ncbi:MAG: DUF1343 domain-containing protein [Acholeplasmataceae bacterium]|nr:DUF1343 domain-containing protein [Acholeplasmataceae bacterium]